MDTPQNDIENLLQDVKIPPAPHILKSLFEELQKDEPILTDIANIIAQDVSISALVLRTVNSALTGLALKRTFEESTMASPPNFWDSPMNIAILAADISHRFVGVEPDEAYMLGLFHNCGHALMLNSFDGYKPFLLDNLNAESLITDLEDNRYHTNHAVLGYFLARSWGIEKNIATLIRDHHIIDRFKSDKAGSDETLLAILKIAEHVDKLFWNLDPDQEWLTIESQVIEHLGLSKPDYDDLESDLLDKLKEGGF